MALLMIGSMVAAAGPGLAVAADPVSEDDIVTQDGDSVTIDNEIATAAENQETVEVYVRLDAAASRNGESLDAESATALKQEAESTQTSLRALGELNDNVEIKSSFWLDNAALVEIDTSEVSLQDLARIDGVVELHPNYEIDRIEPTVTPGNEIADGEPYTYGVEQVNAPEFWEAFDTRGENASIAIVDTGINPDHEAFPDYNESNWAQFDFDGNEIDSEPFDDNGHGTHVAGTAAGGNASGTAIGVAPEAELYSINVFPNPGGGTTLAAIVAGMEHAVEEDIDVANFSLGGGGFASIYVDVIENALEAGTLIVSSSGNSGPNSTGTPGNVYDSVSVGATNVDEVVTSFSTGDEVDTDEDWGAVAPSDWPAEYSTPDVTAPGATVLSADLENGQPVNDAYGTKSGTSMAAPHVTGVVALMISAFDTEPETVSDTLESTAQKPAPDAIDLGVLSDASAVSADQVENLHFDDVSDARYGEGIVDAYAAGLALADNRTISGTVVDSEGNPITDATGVTSIEDANFSTGTLPDGSGPTVTTDGGLQSTYAIDGSFSFDVQADSYDLTVGEAFGYQNDTVTVNATDGDVTGETISLDDQFDVRLAAGQPEEVVAGGSMPISVDLAHVESFRVNLTESATVNRSNLTVAVGQQPIELNESVPAPAGVTTNVPLTVVVDEGVPSGETIELEHTFASANGNETVPVTTGPTTVVEETTGVADLGFSETNITDEALASEPVAPGSLTISNPANETQNATVVWETPLGNLQYPPIEVGPGEEEVLEPALSQPPAWSAFGGPGDTVPYSFALYDDDLELDDRENFETDIVGFDITGTVTDADTGEPVSGVTVTATDGVNTVSAVTNSTGQYSVVADAPGEWTVNAQNDGFGPTAETVSIEADDDRVTQDLTIGSTPTFTFNMEAGEAATIGIPGPVAGGTVGDIIDTDAQAVVFAYNETQADWEQVSGSDTVAPLDALVIVPSEATQATVTLAGEPGDTGTGQPDTTTLTEGWNFVAPPIYGNTSEAFQLTTGEVAGVLQVQDQADSQVAPAGSVEGLELAAAPTDETTTASVQPASEHTLSPFAGYFVFADEAGELGSVVTEGATRGSTYDLIGADATASTGTVTSAVDGTPVGGATVSVNDTDISVQTAPDGSFVLPPLPDGIDQTITVEAPEYASTTASLETTTDVTLQDETYFQVNTLTLSDDALSVGDNYTIDYNLSNEGIATDQQIVDVIIGENLSAGSTARLEDSTSAINSSFIEIEPGESIERTVESEIIATQPTGEVQIGVYTDDDVAIANLTISEQQAAINAQPLETETDQPRTVTATPGVTTAVRP
jgi:subtilisin family serine protease